MDICAQLFGILLDGICQNYITNRSSSSSRSCCSCCCCCSNEPPCCSNESNYDDLDSEEEGQEEEAGERSRLIREVPIKKSRMIIKGVEEAEDRVEEMGS